jgi:hypothetical protein
MRADLTVRELKEHCLKQQRCDTCKYLFQCSENPDRWEIDEYDESGDEE